MRGRDACSPPLGMSAFLLRGWMGWAEALPALHPHSLPAPASADSASVPLPTAPPGHEVVQAIAGLLLSYLGGPA